MIISTNLSAVFSNEQLARTTDRVTKSMERLSSGYKINSSKDDSVGMAVSETMRLKIRGLERGSQNTSDGVSVVETAEGALQEVNEMISRLRELAVQGSNGTYTDEDRANLQSEVDALKEEINRIARDTEFNNVPLLDGSVQRCAYAYDTSSGSTKISTDTEVLYFEDQTAAGRYTFSYSVTTDPKTGERVIDDTSISTGGAFSNVANLQKEVRENAIIFKGSNDFILEVGINKDLNTITSGDGEIEIKDMGGMIIQMGEKEGRNIKITIPKISTKTLGIDNLDLRTEAGAEKSIHLMDIALERVVSVRGRLGAYENRFEHSISSMSVSNESTESSLSRVMDVDMAEEMSNYTSVSVIQQAGISMLAQANQLPEKVLQLLQ